MRALKIFFVLVVFIQLAACAGMAAGGITKEQTLGRDVDEVIAEIEKQGLSCGKYKSKELFTNRVVGGVICSIREKALMCPETYRISLFYEFDTNKVSAFGKDKITNCF